MKILIINNETKLINQLINLFKDHQTDLINAGQEFDESIYDLYILSGGSHHSIFFEPSPYQKEIEFILKTNKRVLGICLGCQIIAKAFGSQVSQSIQRITGVQTIHFNNNSYNVYESHKFSIHTLGKDLVGLSSSVHGYEIIKHSQKPIRGIQFHPEKHILHNQGNEILKIILKEISIL